MLTMEMIRAELLKAYESLPPAEQDLLQLCSLIYEPVNRAALYRIFRKAGLGFPGEKITSTKALEPHLARLKRLELLDDNHQVPRQIIEIVTRRAVAAGKLFPADDFCKGIESEDAWKDDLPAGSKCISCSKAVAGKAFASPLGPLCVACSVSELRALAADEDPHDWPAGRTLAALSPEADIKSRLIGVWMYEDKKWRADLHGVKSTNELHRAIVSSLGYLHPHPLASAVRQAALVACSKNGYAVLPVLLEMAQKEPWQFYANIILAVGYIAPQKPEVQAILKEASDHANPEVRRCLMSLLGGRLNSDWSAEVVKKLSKDQDPTVREMAQRSLAAEKSKSSTRFVFSYDDRYRLPEISIGPPIRFGPVVRAIQEELPVSRGDSRSYGITYGRDLMSCARLMREVRIGIYSQSRGHFHRQWQELASNCGEQPAYASSLSRICNTPFDAAWFAALPAEIQMPALGDIFYQAATRLEPDTETLAFTLKQDLPPKTEASSERVTFLYDLATRLIMGGRLEEAGKVIPEIEGPDYTSGLMAWHRFVQGKNEEAIALFEADLKELRRRVGKRNINFRALPGLFYLLALLKSEDESQLKKVEQLIGWSLSAIDPANFMSSAFRSLQAIAKARSHDVGAAKTLISRESSAPEPISTLFNAIAAFWVNGNLSTEMIERIKAILQRSVKAEMDWVTMECAALLSRVDKESAAVHQQILNEVMSRSGMQPVASIIQIEEPWQKGLRAIIQIAGESDAPAVQKSKADTRLIWLVGYYDGKVSLQPIEQKFTAKGVWSKGRPVAISRLYNRTNLAYMTLQDHSICAAIKHQRYYYTGDEYYFDMDSVLPALVGHPLLFLAKSPSVPVEFVKGEPEIRVSKSSSSLNIRFALEPVDKRVVVIQETPTRFKVIELSEKHRRLAQVLGARGLMVPASAKQEVLEAIAALSSHALVHSDIGGRSKEAEEVAADPTPHVHLMPAGAGLRVEVFVKPFKEEGGPYLKPAVGAANVIADVGGKRMQTRRDLKAEEKMADAVDEASPTLAGLADGDRQWQLEDPEDCLQVLLDLKALQDRGQAVVAWPEGEKLKVTREVSVDHLRMKIRSNQDWFEVNGELRVDNNLVVDMKRLLELLETTSTRFIPLQDGQFLALTRDFRRKLDELSVYTERKGRAVRLHPLAALAMQDLTEAIPHLEVDKAWKKRIEQIQSARVLDPAAPSTLKAELRDYQLQGYTWLARLAHMGIGACLADDMGLGKTLQALAILLHRATEGPSLVVAPTSVCWNWVAEANRFAPTLNVLQFGGNKRQELVKGLKPHDVLVTSYGLLVQEEELLSSAGWNVIVLDESQAIKNVSTRRSRAAMTLNAAFKMITTGTPIENHLGELWTLFNFINPGLLGSLQRFNERFALPIEKYQNRDARHRLKRLIQPFVLRRMKSQVLEELPPRTEVVLQVEMDVEEAAFYEALRQQALVRIDADRAPAGQKHLQILAEITRLRQAACNPRLVMPEAPITSSKLDLFGDIVEELLGGRHKALVFSQFVGHLNLIREYLDHRSIRYRYLDGSTPPKARTREVEAFQAGDGDLFLISLKAGGLGLNLTAADYVIHMDPWWNPAVEDQASDRAHRIGQQHPVTIYRLVTRSTIEEKIVKLHQEKRDLAGSLLDGSDISGKISPEELIKLIREQ